MRKSASAASPSSIETWGLLLQTLNEAQRRYFAAHKALEIGHGGIERVHEVTGLARGTIIRGIKELRNPKKVLGNDRIRRPGGGRKKIETLSKEMLQVFDGILGENTAGDPMSLLKWTHRSTRSLADEMTRIGYPMSRQTVWRLLDEQGYSLQSNRKSIGSKSSSHPQRDAQFKHINATAKEFVDAGDPVISVDTKKKELVGNFKNAGQTWEKKGKPKRVSDHDFESEGLGHARPYGVYDEQRNHGMVNVGVNNDTGEFAVESIRQWWCRIGCKHYPEARRLLICADNGGSNGSQTRLWKYHVQRLADETGLAISVCHYPPGTSKWNKIEHRMFSFISLNWRGQPLESYEAVISLIGGTTTRKGLKVDARLDLNIYEKGIKVSDEEMEQLRITRDPNNPSWNYTFAPEQNSRRATRLNMRRGKTK